MLPVNTMRYGTDEFQFNKSGIVTSNTTAWDCTDASKINGFNITSTVPDGCKIRIAFLVNSILGIIENDGQFAPLSDQSYDENSILEQGNTPEFLKNLVDVAAFVGKKVSPVIALWAPENATNLPKIKIELKKVSAQDVYSKEIKSEEFDFSGYEIQNINFQPRVDAGGQVIAEARLYNNETWGEWMSINDVKGKSGTRLQLRVTLKSSQLGVSTAALTSLCLYGKLTNSLTVANDASLVIKQQTFSEGMAYGRLYLKHKRFNDASVDAYICFSDKPKTRERFKIGTGTGDSQVIALEDKNVNFATLRLYENSNPILKFYYNTADNTITFTAHDKAIIYASYDYEVAPEDWQPMKHVTDEPYKDNPIFVNSYYAYPVTGAKKTASSIKLILHRPDGESTGESLGYASGQSQQFVLNHFAREESIVVKQGESTISRRNWTYDPINKMLTVIGIKDRELTVNYKWSADTPEIYSYTIAWNH